MEAEAQFQPGERITHHEFGQGVVLDPARDGYLRAFFGVGERRVPVGAVRRQLSRTERILRGLHDNRDGGADRARKAWLSYEAHALPVMESASALTSAKIDLLPHQVVLTHRITDRFVSHRITQTYIHRETHFLTNALSLNRNGFYFN